MATKDSSSGTQNATLTAPQGMQSTSDTKATAIDAGLKTAEVWTAELKVEDWKFAAAKAYFKWPLGRQFTRADFVEAIAELDTIVCR